MKRHQPLINTPVSKSGGLNCEWSTGDRLLCLTVFLSRCTLKEAEVLFLHVLQNILYSYPLLQKAKFNYQETKCYSWI